MAINVNPYSWYQDWNNVLPLAGYQLREGDNGSAWYRANPDEGTGLLRFEDGMPTDPGVQAAPQRLYEEALRQQGYVPTSMGDLGYYAQYGQYGDGQGFGGDVSKYLDYVYGPGWQAVNDPTHGFLIKPADAARAINGAGTPVALPDRSGSFGDFLMDGAKVIAPLATMAFAPGLAGALGGGTLGSIGAGSILNGGIAALSGGNPLEGALTGAISGGIGSALPSVGVTDPTLGGAIRGGISSALSGGDPLQGAAMGAAFSGLNQLSGDNFTLTADGGSNEPSSMPVSVNSVGNDFLNNLVAQNQGTYAGADSITGGGPTTPLPSSYLSGVNNPFQFIPSIVPQSDDRDSGGNVEDWSNWMLPGDIPESSDFFGAPGFDMDPYTLTDAQQWAKGLGALNEDGSINWGAIDSGDPFGMGSTDGAPVVPDAGIGLSGAKTAASMLAKLLMGSNADGSTRSFFDAVGGNKGLLPSLLPAALGAYGSNQQAQAYRDVSDKYMAMGAPFRQRLADSYGAGFKASEIPGYNEALDSTSNAIMRKLSTTGNPFDNPGGLMEANRYVMENTALPAINNYRSQLGTFGQLGTNTAGAASLGAIPAKGGVYDAIGAGLYNATKEQDPFATTMAALYRSMMPGGNYKLNAGMGV